MIKIKNLTKEFDGLTFLEDISFEVEKGVVISIIGPSGSGKSTMLRCVNLLEKPTVGEVVVNGKTLTEPNMDITKAREKIGMVFQHFHLFPHLTVLRSEEHTSELQSRGHLVCRLLLEKRYNK